MSDPEEAEVIEISSDEDSVLITSDSSPSVKIFTPTMQEPSPAPSR